MQHGVITRQWHGSATLEARVPRAARLWACIRCRNRLANTSVRSLSCLRENNATSPLSHQAERTAISRRTTSLIPHRRQISSNAEYAEAKSQDFGIVGGGITGLATAYYITKAMPNASVTIYEKSSRMGGWLQSSLVPVPGEEGSVLFEGGPRSLRPAGNGVLSCSLLSDLGLVEDTIFTGKSSAAATSRFIYYPDHLVELKFPPAPGWFGDLAVTALTESAFQGTPWGLLKEGFVEPRDDDVSDESVGSFLSRRISPSFADRLASAIFHGIYAGDIHRLSARSLLPIPWKFEGKHTSILEGVLANRRRERREGKILSKRERRFMSNLSKLPSLPEDLGQRVQATSVFTFRKGLSQLTDALIMYLKRNSKVEFKQNSTIKSIARSKTNMVQMETDGGEQQHSNVIWTPEPAGLSALVRGPSERPNTIRELGSIPSETVMTVNLYYKQKDLHPPGFGYLIPLAVDIDHNPENALGVVFDNCYAPDPGESSPDFSGPCQDTVTSRGTKLTVMIGGHYWSHWKFFPTEAEGLEMARSVLRRHLGITQEPAVSAINIQRDCIPQYVVGHHSKLEKIHQWLLTDFGGSMRVAGSWINGVGVNDCLRSAFDTVQDLTSPGKTGLESVVEEDEEVEEEEQDDDD